MSDEIKKEHSCDKDCEENLCDAEQNLADVSQSDEKSKDENSQNSCEFDNLQKEFDELKATYIRKVADFENIKKRMEKEKVLAVEFANESFARDLLPIMDALEIAIKTEVAEGELAAKIKQGVEMTINLFLKSFEKYGITAISTECKFDPQLHNAINTIEAQGKQSGDIVEVYQKGYKFKDRILRPSMVVVAK